jgi:hypothetical protein
MPPLEPDTPLSSARALKLAELRSLVVSSSLKLHAADVYWTTDHALLRVLSARSDDVIKAVAQYEGIVNFRLQKECYRFLDPTFYTEPESMRRYFGWGFAGVDNDGFPVLVERIGKNDVLSLSESVGTDEFLRWVIFYHECQEKMMREASMATGRDRHKMSVLVDLAGYKLAGPATLSIIFARTRMEEDNYPEIVRRIFLLNVPSLFSTLWGVVSAFMDAGTRSKVQLLGSNYLPTLLKYINASNIPSFLGGQLADERADPQCQSMVAKGGVLPLAFLTGVAADGNGIGEEVKLAAGTTSSIVLCVNAGSTVTWAWGISEKDVTFKVEARPDTSSSKDTSLARAGVIETGNMKTSFYGIHRLPFTQVGDDATWPTTTTTNNEIISVSPVERGKKGKGTWTAPPNLNVDHANSINFYRVRLTWDNTSSWMTSKHLARRVDVLLDGCDHGKGANRAVDIDGELACEREKHRLKIAQWITSNTGVTPNDAIDDGVVKSLSALTVTSSEAVTDEVEPPHQAAAVSVTD